MYSVWIMCTAGSYWSQFSSWYNTWLGRVVQWCIRDVEYIQMFTHRTPTIAGFKNQHKNVHTKDAIVIQPFSCILFCQISCFTSSMHSQAINRSEKFHKYFNYWWLHSRPYSCRRDFHCIHGIHLYCLYHLLVLFLRSICGCVFNLFGVMWLKRK